MTKIVKPSVLKRALVAVADFALFLFVVLGFYAAGQAIANSSEYGTSLQKEINGYQINSHLYYLNEDGNATPYDNLASYTDYQEKIVYFYTVFLRNEPPEGSKKTYDVYWYNVHILGLDDTRGLYPKDVIEEPAKTKGKDLFQYVGEDYDQLGVPQDKLHVDGDPSKPLTDMAKSQLLVFYYAKDQINAYFNAGHTLYYLDFFQKALTDYQRIANIAPVVAGIVASGLIFYLILPLIFKNGATLCKKAFGLCLLGAGGYKVHRAQVLLRQAPPILLAGVLFFFVPFIYAVMASSLILLVSYVLSIFTPRNQALHDFLAYTTVIDAKNSLFYRNEAEEKAAEEAFQGAMDEADRLLKKGEEILHQEAKDKALK